MEGFSRGFLMKKDASKAFKREFDVQEAIWPTSLHPVSLGFWAPFQALE